MSNCVIDLTLPTIEYPDIDLTCDGPSSSEEETSNYDSSYSEEEDDYADLEDAHEYVFQDSMRSRPMPQIISSQPQSIVAVDDVNNQISPNEDVPAEKACCICLTQLKSHAIIPCGHICLCDHCVAWMFDAKKCPICNGEKQGTIKIFY